MTARPEYDFEKTGKYTTKYGVGTNCFPQPAQKPKMPDKFEDVLDGHHYLHERNGKIDVHERNGKIDQKVKEFVDAIVNGDLAKLKAMDSKFIQKYLNQEVVRSDMVYNHPLAKDEINGFSPLMIAAICGKTDVMRWLMDLGANIELKTAKPSQYAGNTAADYLKHYKEVQDKKRAEELRKQKEADKKQKQKDELNDLMDEVDGKKPPKTAPTKPSKPYPIKISHDFDEILRKEMDKIKTGKGIKVDGPTKKKEPKKGQFGNGKGIDDKLGKLQQENVKNYAIENQTKRTK